MAISFLGASVSSFNTNISFGLEPSELSVTLVEDKKAGDRFSPPPVGEPILFEVGDFAFGGFLQSWVERTSTDGHIFEIKIVDPREFLGGISLILKGYSGHTGGIHNLFNIYNYQLTNNPSSLSDAGIQWKDVLGAFNSLSNGVLKYRNYSFRIGLSALPDLPYYYRVGGDTISLLDFVADICDAASLDFHTTFDGTNIVITPFSRTSQPRPGAIKRFIDSVEGASAKEVGEELRLDTVNRFLLGGKVRQFHFQYSSIYEHEVQGGSVVVPTYNIETNRQVIGTGTDQQVNAIINHRVRNGESPGSFEKTTNPDGSVKLEKVTYSPKNATSTSNKPSSITSSSDHNIWPYWGEDTNGNLIIGEGYNDDHRFTLNVQDTGIKFRGVPQIGYFTDVSEIRAAGESQESWEAFLAALCGNKYKMDPNGTKTGFIWDDNQSAQSDTLSATILANRAVRDGNHPYDSLLSGMSLYPKIQSRISGMWASYRRNALVDKKDETKGYVGGITLVQLVDRFYEEELADLENENIFITYKHSGQINLHYGKVYMLNLHEVISTDAMANLLDTSHPIDAIDINSTGYSPKTKTSSRSEHEFALERLHNKLGEMYNSYYGRKFIVTIPFNVTKLDGDITTINTTLLPTDSAPIEPSMVNTAIANKTLPALYHKFITSDGKIESYVRSDLALKLVRSTDTEDFYDFAEIDTSAISPEDMVYSNDGSSVFVRCTVEPEIKFINRDVLFGPRAVIELPGQLLYKDSEELGGGHLGNMNKVMNDVIAMRGANGEDVAGLDPSDIIAGFGAESMFQGRMGLMAYPIMAAIPLESQVNRYGPFYNLNMPGKVEIEIDDSLTPWAFGSYDNMSGAGYAKIIDSLSMQYSSETGTLTIPGFPAISPGSQLVANGPNITGITCSVTDAGVLTTYRMSSWTNRVGKLAKQYVDTVQKHTADLYKLRAQMQKRISVQTGRARGGVFSKQKNRPARLKDNSTHAVLGADVKDSSYSVSTLPHYHFNEQVGGAGYENRAFMSLDGLFVPVAFGSGHIGDLPQYPYLSASGASGIDVSCNTLNPYYDGSTEGVRLIAKGENPSDSNVISSEGMDVRGLGLKAPLILAGWGFDTGGNAVPSGVSGAFADDYKTDISQWKVGPLDTRWDDTRKVWSAAGGGGVRLAYAHRAASVNKYTKFELIDTKKYAETRFQLNIDREDFSDGEVDVFNPFAALPSGSVAVIAKDDDNDDWLIVSAWGQI